MAPNFHTPWAGTPFVASAMNAPLATLDKAITKLKNIMVGGGGAITYVKATGVLTWSAVININFTSDAGLTVKNTIAAGNATLADNQFAYVDLSETTNTVLTVTVASIPAGGAASTMKGYNRMILVWRDANDNLYPVWLHPALNETALISDEAYDATTWDGVDTVAPSKNAVRDKIETLILYGTGAAPDPTGIADGTVYFQYVA